MLWTFRYVHLLTFSTKHVTHDGVIFWCQTCLAAQPEVRQKQACLLLGLRQPTRTSSACPILQLGLPKAKKVPKNLRVTRGKFALCPPCQVKGRENCHPFLPHLLLVALVTAPYLQELFHLKCLGPKSTPNAFSTFLPWGSSLKSTRRVFPGT